MGESLVSAAVQITLDGRPFELRFSAYAFIRYTEETESDLLADIAALGKRLSGLQEFWLAASKAEDEAAPAKPASAAMFGKLRDVLWAALLDRHEGITRDQVARLIDLGAINDIMTGVMQALHLTMPKTATRPPKPAPAKRRGGAMIDGSGSGLPSATVPASAPESSAA